MKKFFKLLLCVCFVFSSAIVFAQDDIYIFDCGKNKGKIRTVTQNSTMYVDAQTMAKKLGGEGSFSSQSKQLRITIKNFNATFTEGSRDVVKNGKDAKLPLPAISQKGRIYVPVEFFLDKELAAVFNKSAMISDGKFCLENKYNIEYVNSISMDESVVLNFDAPSEIDFSVARKNRSVVEARLKNSIIKREGTTRFKDKFITKFTAKKCGNDVCLTFLMTPKAKSFSFDRQGNSLVFAAFPTDGAPTLAPEPDSAPVAPRQQPDSSPAQDSLSGNDDEDDDDSDAEEISSAVFFGGAATSAAAGAAGKPSSSAKAPAVPSSVVSKGDVKSMRIVIDPGHGGKDPGAVRKNSSTEKYINLAVAKELAAKLKKRGFNVKITRDDDRFLALHERSKIANQFDADLFVSIHTNASKRSAAQGFEVYFRSEKATDAEAAEVAALENEALQYEETNLNFADMLLRSLAVNEYVNESSKAAGHVRNSMKNTSGTGINVSTNNSIRQANFYVLKGVDAPAILVEMGYISNPNDRRQLNNKNIRVKIADGIYKGILNYAKAEGWK